MRKILLLCLALFSLNSLGSHLLGGEIYWECAGSGQYVFYMNLYRDCGAGSASLPSTTNISGPAGFIPMTVQSQVDISPTCSGGGSVFCIGSPSGNGAMQRYTYKSVPTTLVGNPPPAGWSFFYFDCCRPGGIVNTFTGQFYLESKMYAGTGGCNSSPHFVASPAVGINKFNKTLSVMAQSANHNDSLYYDFVAPHSAAATPVVFNAGYSASAPFPNPLTNAANGPISMDHKFGIISMDIQNMTAGGYAYGIKVQQWRNNVLLSEVVRDMTMIGKPNINTNNPPATSIDSINFSFASPSVVEAFVGDTVYIEISGADADYNGSANRFQYITFTGQGRALDSAWGGIANYVSKPLISNSNQFSYTNSLVTRVIFKWVLAPEHHNGSTTSHDFIFTFNDDHCPFNGISHLPLRINVNPISSIPSDTLRMCEKDSTAIVGFTKSGTYNWSPSNGLSSTTVSDPMASPANSQYYYLTDPTNPGFIDSVYVEVTPRSYFNLAFTNGQLTLTDSNGASAKTWFYNGIPFNYPSDTLTPFGLGDYYVIGKSGVCEYISDTISITAGMSFSVTAPNNGGYAGTPAVVTGALGVTFQVNQNVNVSWVSIPGISDVYGKTGGYDLNLKVYDNTQTEIFNTDVTIARPIDNVLKVPANLNLMANQDYTVVVSGDTGYAFSLYDNMALPATPQNVGFTVKALLGGNARQFPTTPVTYALPISLGIDKTVSLDEISENRWSIYPNPAKEQVQIVGLEGAKTIELIDVNGKTVRSIILEKDSIETTLTREGLTAGIYLIKVQFEDSTSVKKVLFE